MDQTKLVVLVTCGSGMSGRALMERLRHAHRVVGHGFDPGRVTTSARPLWLGRRPSWRRGRRGLVTGMEGVR